MRADARDPPQKSRAATDTPFVLMMCTLAFPWDNLGTHCRVPGEMKAKQRAFHSPEHDDTRRPRNRFQLRILMSRIGRFANDRVPIG